MQAVFMSTTLFVSATTPAAFQIICLSVRSNDVMMIFVDFFSNIYAPNQQIPMNQRIPSF
jgi:hypothetical protein